LTLIFYILLLSLVILAFDVLLSKQCKSWGKFHLKGWKRPNIHMV
jgi:hypothetical protein